MTQIKKRKCKNCHSFFSPDPRNASRQKYCGKEQCRKESKRASQRKWLEKPENQDYFRSPGNTKRVQEWREARRMYDASIVNSASAAIRPKFPSLTQFYQSILFNFKSF